MAAAFFDRYGQHVMPWGLVNGAVEVMHLVKIQAQATCRLDRGRGQRQIRVVPAPSALAKMPCRGRAPGSSCSSFTNSSEAAESLIVSGRERQGEL